jgi:hypothetical protein
MSLEKANSIRRRETQIDVARLRRSTQRFFYQVDSGARDEVGDPPANATILHQVSRQFQRIVVR